MSTMILVFVNASRSLKFVKLICGFPLVGTDLTPQIRRSVRPIKSDADFANHAAFIHDSIFLRNIFELQLSVFDWSEQLSHQYLPIITFSGPIGQNTYKIPQIVDLFLP